MGQLTDDHIADNVIRDWKTRMPNRPASQIRQMVDERLALSWWAREMDPLARVQLRNRVANIIYQRLANERKRNCQRRKSARHAAALARAQGKLF